MILKFSLLIIATEALVELICKAEILNRPRYWIQSRCWFFKELLSCPYCVSVWVGMFVALLLWIDNTYVFIVIYGLCFHRLSNFLHLLFSWVRDSHFNIILNRNRREDTDGRL
jgi:hypothetical protein